MLARWWTLLRRSTAPPVAASPSWFRPALLCVTVVGLVARVGFALSVWSRRLPGDARFFHTTAANIASGKGYAKVTNFGPLHLGLVPTAGHPPVFPALLATLDLLGLRSVGAQRIAVAVVASSGVFLVGMLGRKVAGASVGVAAAGIAAVDPLWFQPSGILMSESIYLVVIPGLLLMALFCAEKPSLVRYALLGLLVGVAALIRSEAILLALFLALPLALFARQTWRQRATATGALVVGLALVLGPWLVRNEIQLGGFVLANDSGVTLAGSYCAATFDPNQPQYGSFDLHCALGTGGLYVLYVKPPGGARHWTERTLNDAVTSASIRFARGHLADLPGVVVARELSVWGFPDQTWARSLSGGEGRVYGYELAGQILYWIELPFAIIGIAALARRSWPFFIVVMPLAVVALNAALFYGSTRMRVAAEPSLAVLAAVGGVALVSVIRARPRGKGALDSISPKDVDPTERGTGAVLRT